METRLDTAYQFARPSADKTSALFLLLLSFLPQQKSKARKNKALELKRAHDREVHQLKTKLDLMEQKERERIEEEQEKERLRLEAKKAKAKARKASKK